MKFSLEPDHVEEFPAQNKGRLSRFSTVRLEIVSIGLELTNAEASTRKNTFKLVKTARVNCLKLNILFL